MCQGKNMQYQEAVEILREEIRRLEATYGADCAIHITMELARADCAILEALRELNKLENA